MKNLALTIVTFLIFINGYAQEADSTLAVKKRKYFQNEQQINKAELSKLLANNPASNAEYKKWMTNNYIGSAFALGGVVIITTAAIIDFSSTLKQTQDLDNGIYTNDYPSAGLGLYLGGLVCTITGFAIVVNSNKKHLSKSIDFYNSSFSETANRQIKFEMIANSGGIGIKMTF